MRLSLLSLFSIKNSSSFVPLNFINEAIIRDAASEAARSPARDRCVPAAGRRRRSWPHRAGPARSCGALINRWSPALHELQRFLTFIPLSPLNFIRSERSHFIYDLAVDNYTDNFIKFLQYPTRKNVVFLVFTFTRNVIMQSENSIPVLMKRYMNLHSN